MRRKSKYSKELKLSIVKRYLDGEGSTVSLAKEINATDGVVGNWVKQYNVGKLMKENNIKAHYIKPYTVTTKDCDFSNRLH
ncbi:hypothetical protein CWE04_06290, partial [Thomasclavelia cocleata]